MSELKVTNLSHPSSGSANITLAADGSVVLPAGFTGGVGSNVVSNDFTPGFSTTSSSFVDITGVSISITPTTATAKVFVIVSGSVKTGASGNVVETRLERDGTTVLPGRSRSESNSGDSFQTISVIGLDSPATTSAVTYQFQMRSSAGATAQGFQFVLTAIEVAA